MSYKEKANKFIKKWEGTYFDGGASITPEFKSFAQGFKRLMKEIGEVDNKSFKPGHFYVSGFINVDGQYIYVSISDVRHFQNEWVNHVLYRTAENTTDYTGGINNYSSLEDLEDNIKRLLR